MCNWDKCPLMFSQSVIKIPKGLFVCLWWGEGRGSLQLQTYLYHHCLASFGNPAAEILQSIWEPPGEAPFTRCPEAVLSIPLTHRGLLRDHDQRELFIKLPPCRDTPGHHWPPWFSEPAWYQDLLPPSITYLPFRIPDLSHLEVCLALRPDWEAWAMTWSDRPLSRYMNWAML